MSDGTDKCQTYRLSGGGGSGKEGTNGNVGGGRIEIRNVLEGRRRKECNRKRQNRKANS
jgi:hypothetical protein